MTTEMFGTPFGFQSYDSDQARLAQMGAQTRLMGAHADLFETEIAEKQRELRALSSLPGTQPGDEGKTPLQQASDLLGRQAVALAKAGMPKKASEVAQKAATLVLDEQRVKTGQSLQAYREMQVKHGNLSEVNALASGVTDQASLNQALMLWMQRHPGEQVPQELTTYDPQKLEMIRRTSAEGMKQIDQQMREADLVGKEKGRQSAEDFRSFREQYMRSRLGQAGTGLSERGRHNLEMEGIARTRADAARIRAEKGATGKVPIIGFPTKGESDAAFSAIKSAYPNLPPKEISLAADDIASRTRQLYKTNPGMAPAQALSQAMDESKGDFGTLDNTYKVFGLEFGSKGTTYKKGGPAPLPMPRSPGDAKIGTIYQTAKGPAKWTGQNFVPVGGAPPAKAAAAPARAATPPPEEDLMDEEND